MVLYLAMTDAEELSRLHDLHIAGMGMEEMLSYLFECQEMLKIGDLESWKRKYAPGPPPPPPKRRRMSPSEVLWKPRDPCIDCGSSEIVEDAREGNVVCIMCGMIQSSLVGTSIAPMYAGHLARFSPIVVHRYSRIVYFRSFILSMLGATDPEISDDHLESLRRTIVGGASKKNVHCALKTLGLLTKYRRHIPSLAWRLSIEATPSGPFSPLVLKPSVFFELLRLFRRVEYYWDIGGHKKAFKKRCVFYSYPYVFYQLCHHMGVPELSGPHHLLKSRKLLQRLHASFGPLAASAGLNCDVSVFR